MKKKREAMVDEIGGSGKIWSVRSFAQPQHWIHYVKLVDHLARSRLSSTKSHRRSTKVVAKRLAKAQLASESFTTTSETLLTNITGCPTQSNAIHKLVACLEWLSHPFILFFQPEVIASLSKRLCLQPRQPLFFRNNHIINDSSTTFSSATLDSAHSTFLVI